MQKEDLKFNDKVTLRCGSIGIVDRDKDVCFPYFFVGTMYKGLEVGKEYSIEKLGL